MVMQHADSFNSVEAAAGRPQLQNVGLCILDVGQALLAGLSSCISQAWPAEIDGENTRAGRFLRDVEGVLAGAASRDQNLLRQRVRVGALSTHLFIEAGERVDDPARI